jgi:hypothetical protein
MGDVVYGQSASFYMTAELTRPLARFTWLPIAPRGAIYFQIKYENPSSNRPIIKSGD